MRLALSQVLCIPQTGIDTWWSRGTSWYVGVTCSALVGVNAKSLGGDGVNNAYVCCGDGSPAKAFLTIFIGFSFWSIMFNESSTNAAKQWACSTSVNVLCVNCCKH